MKQDDIYQKIQGYRKGHLVKKQAFNTTSGEYALPIYVRGKPLHIVKTIGSREYRLEQVNFGERWFNTGDSFYSGAEKVSYEHRNLVFRPTPGTTTGTPYTMFYNWKVPWLHTGTAAAGDDTSMTLEDTIWVDKRDDYYNGIEVELVGGTGAGERATITDYTGSTRVATVDFTTDPDTDSVYAMVSPLPEECHNLMVYGAAMLGRMKAREEVDDLKKLYEEIETAFLIDLGLQGDVYSRHSEEDFDLFMLED